MPTPVELDEKLEEMVEEYKEHHEKDSKNATIKDMIAKGFVFGYIKPEMVRIHDEIDQREQLLKTEENLTDEEREKVKQEIEDLEEEMTNFAFKTLYKFHEEIRDAEIGRCPVCGGTGWNNLHNLSQHINAKKDSEHKRFKDVHDLDSVSEIEDHLKDIANIRSLVEPGKLDFKKEDRS